jgi:hypothetical protein
VVEQDACKRIRREKEEGRTVGEREERKGSKSNSEKCNLFSSPISLPLSFLPAP